MMKRFLSMITAVLLAILSASAQNGTLDPTNPPEPSAKYRLTVKAQPAEAATTSGSGEYAEGTQVTVKATAKANYVFKHWLQNGTQISQTATSWKLTMPADYVELVAVFEYQEPEFDPTNPAEPQYITPEYALYLVADPAGAGTFNRTSGAKVKEGTTVSIKATPTAGYQFTGWYDAAGTQLSTAQTLSYTMPSQVATLTARFTYNPTNPNEPSGSQTGVDNSADGVVLTARSYTRQYGEANPTFGYDVTSGTITSGTPTLSCSATKTSPVGTYDIIISKGTVSNSSIGLVNGTLTITRAPLTISAGDYTKVEGEANPTFTPTFSGFKNGETKSVLTKQPTVTTTATTNSPAGTYPVTVSGAEAQNYDISYQQGTLTVTPKSTPSELPTLSIEDFSIKAGEEAEMLIDMSNPNHKIMGVQFDLRLPEGLSVLSEDDEYYVFIAGRTTSSNHYMNVYPKSDGTVTVYMIPTGTTPISGTSGAIISIELTASATFKGGDIRLENIGLATPEGVQFSIDDYVYTLGAQPQDENLVTPPAGLKTEKYYVTGVQRVWDGEKFEPYDMDGYVMIGMDGNDVYMQGLCPWIEDAWIKGTRTGNKVVFPTGQYYGQDEGDDIYFVGADNNTQTICDVTLNYDSEADEYTLPSNFFILDSTNKSTRCLSYYTELLLSKTFRTVWVEEAGTLADIIGDDDKYTYYGLKLFGELNSTDFRLLRDMAGSDYMDKPTQGKLRKLDMLNADVVVGGIDYLEWNYAGTWHIEKDNELGNSVFEDCNKLEEVILPIGLKSIKRDAFDSCANLTKVVFNDSLISMGDGVFSNTNLINVELPDGLTTMGCCIFYGCKNLISTTIPKNMQTKLSQTFFSCNNLQSVHSHLENPEGLFGSTSITAFDYYDDNYNRLFTNATLYVPVGCKSKYEQAEGWKLFYRIVEEGTGTSLAGDVNRDEIVGIGDIVAVTNFMAGSAGNITQERADVNGDGDVGIGDIVAITNIMAGSAAARQQ